MGGDVDVSELRSCGRPRRHGGVEVEEPYPGNRGALRWVHTATTTAQVRAATTKKTTTSPPRKPAPSDVNAAPLCSRVLLRPGAMTSCPRAWPGSRPSCGRGRWTDARCGRILRDRAAVPGADHAIGIPAALVVAVGLGLAVVVGFIVAALCGLPCRSPARIKPILELPPA